MVDAVWLMPEERLTAAWRALNLNRKTLSAGTAPGGVWVHEVKTISIQATAKIQHGIADIEKTLEVSHQFYPLVFKHLVHGLGLGIKVQFIGKATTPATYYGHANEKSLPQTGFLPKRFYLFFCLFTDV